jgi:hypothetical protein
LGFPIKILDPRFEFTVAVDLKVSQVTCNAAGRMPLK